MWQSGELGCNKSKIDEWFNFWWNLPLPCSHILKPPLTYPRISKFGPLFHKLQRKKNPWVATRDVPHQGRNTNHASLKHWHFRWNAKKPEICGKGTRQGPKRWHLFLQTPETQAKRSCNLSAVSHNFLLSWTTWNIEKLQRSPTPSPFGSPRT